MLCTIHPQHGTWLVLKCFFMVGLMSEWATCFVEFEGIQDNFCCLGVVMKDKKLQKSLVIKIILMIIGTFTLGLGLVGVAIPVLPTTPFLLVSAACYANSSDRLHAVLLKSKLYKNTVDKFIREG